MMKTKFFYLFFLLLTVCAATSCEKDESEPAATKTVNVPAEANYFGITITATGGGWSVTKLPAWISLTPDHGPAGSAEVKVVVNANPDTKERRGYVKFSSDYVLGVVQAGK